MSIRNHILDGLVPVALAVAVLFAGVYLASFIEVAP